MAGALCAIHDGTRAVFVCERCGSFGCAACRGRSVGASKCKACESRESLPWERGAELGWVRAFYETTRMFLREPRRAVLLLRAPAGAGAALGYGVVAYTAGQVISMTIIGLFLMLGGGVLAGLLASMGATGAGEASMVGGALAIYGVCMVIGAIPLSVMQGPMYGGMGIAIGSLAAHGTLLLLGKAKGRVDATLRAVSYANAAHLLQAIPIVGAFAVPFVVAYLEVLALREVHGIDTGSAVIAALGYRALFFLLMLALIGLYVMLVLQGQLGGSSQDPPGFGGGSF